MKKTTTSIVKDRISKNGKIWVKRPSLDYRQSSGVEFRGMYLTKEEYRNYVATGYFPTRKNVDEEDLPCLT